MLRHRFIWMLTCSTTSKSSENLFTKEKKKSQSSEDLTDNT